MEDCHGQDRQRRLRRSPAGDPRPGDALPQPQGGCARSAKYQHGAHRDREANIASLASTLNPQIVGTVVRTAERAAASPLAGTGIDPTQVQTLAHTQEMAHAAADTIIDATFSDQALTSS